MREVTSPGGLAAALIACVLLGGCANSLDRDRQYCLECALRRTPHSLDDRDAAAQFREGCEAGDAASCSVLGVMVEQGRSGPPDPRAAAHLYQRACVAGNAWGCVNLGRALESGATGNLDREGARLTYELACRSNLPAGCYQLGRWHYRAGDVKQAVVALEHSCRGGDADACMGLGSIYQHGHGLAADRGRAEAFFLQACGQGSVEACQRLDQLGVRRPGGSAGSAPPL